MSKWYDTTIPDPNRFGFLVIEKRLGRKVWCRCDCGTEKVLKLGNLISKSTVSCGCYAKVKNLKHGLARRGKIHPDYGIWTHMVGRCCNETDTDYASYGGRGITICPRWRESFANFLEDMGPRPRGKELDRINNNGNYEPGNCRWATRSQQNRNTRRTNNITYNGEIRCLTEWASIVGVDRETLRYRIKKWGLDRAMTTPRRE